MLFDNYLQPLNQVLCDANSGWMSNVQCGTPAVQCTQFYRDFSMDRWPKSMDAFHIQENKKVGR